MDGGLVEECAFLVAEPTPLIEISTHIDHMYPQHFQRFVGGLCVVMDNGGMWKIDGEVIAMNTASKIHIFGVHEETLIKKSCLLHRLCEEKHEAAAEVWDIHEAVVARSMHLVSAIATVHPFAR